MLEAIQVVAEPTRKKLLAVIALNLAIPAKVMAGLAEIYAFLSDSDNFHLFLTFSFDFGFERGWRLNIPKDYQKKVKPLKGY